MKYKINKKQYNELNAVYAGIWTLKHSSIDITDEERQIIRNCINFNFEQLDKMGTPFIIQNIVISLAEKKSNIDRYFNFLLEEKGIEVI